MGNSRDSLIDQDFDEEDSTSIYQNTMSTLTTKKGSSLMCRYVNICCGLQDCVAISPLMSACCMSSSNQFV